MLKQSAEENRTPAAQLACNMDSLNQMARARPACAREPGRHMQPQRIVQSLQTACMSCRLPQMGLGDELSSHLTGNTHVLTQAGRQCLCPLTLW
jgi:hypothetical protein